MSLRPRPEIENLEICPHGGANWAELKAMGLAPDGVLDFSVSSNPFAPPPGLKRVLRSVAINRYPDSEATELRERLAERLGVVPKNLLAGNGSMEIIRLIALAYFRQGDAVLILEPTFGEYEVACQIAGAKVIKQWRKEADGFALKVEDAASLIRQHRPRGVFLCNPNNPSGDYLSRPEIETILDSCGSSLLIVDEAFIVFVEEGWSSLDLVPRGNVIIVRSMTKDYNLAGLRLGYAVAHTEIIDMLNRVRPPWNVNVVAQKAGVATLEDKDYLERCPPRIREAKQFLIGEFHRIGFTAVPSKANFFLVKVGDARAFRTALLKRGILVRDCSSFGLPEYVRIAARPMPECRRLISTIESLNSGEDWRNSEPRSQTQLRENTGGQDVRAFI